jgi:Icc-related predicted phosphoesterase
MSILYLCDLHGRNRGLDRLLTATEPDLVLVGGDITHNGGGDEARAVLQPIVAAGVSLLAVPGNMDRPEVADALDDLGVSIHGRGRAATLPRAAGELARIGVLGVGGSTPTPFGTPFELSEQQVAALLEAAWPAVRDCAPVVLVAHPPPFGTRLDRAGATHVGSRAVRAFVAQHALAVSLSGHIHESVGQQRLAGTLCVNPGAFRSGRYATVAWSAAGKPLVKLAQIEP